ncbi:MAG: helix-turn-helix transcriptional regulator [Kofleriaceae bacterium]|nr:helix-turn-helix transcriptional regulator [Kofleriaceae bacterium]
MSSKQAVQLLACIAANVQRTRQRQGLTQQQVTDLIDIDLRHFRRIERGTENITIETLVKLAFALQVPPIALLRKAALRPPQNGRPRRRRIASPPG